MLTFELLDLKPRNPYLSIALDEALCKYASTFPEFEGGVRLWTNPYSVILGRTCIPEKNLDQVYFKKFNISHKKSRWSSWPQLCRRASGGGTVLHGPGNLNYSIFLPLDKHPDLFALKKSYFVLLGMLQNVLSNQGIHTRIQGSSDLAVVDSGGSLRKISGNAQFRKYGMLMHHGTLIMRNDIIDIIARYLRHPPSEPDYRGGRGHSDFLGHLPESFDLSSFHSCLSEEMKKVVRRPLEQLEGMNRRKVFEMARKMAYENYGCESWILSGKVCVGNERTRSAESAGAAIQS